MNEDVKTVMIRCDDNIEALLFRKYNMTVIMHLP